MGQYMPYVNFFSVVVDRCDQSRLVPTDVEDREFSNLVGVGKNCPHLLNIQEIGTPNLIEPSLPHNPGALLQNRSTVYA